MPDIIYSNDPDAGPYRDLYDITGTLQRVRDEMVTNRIAQGWDPVIPTVTVTGTAIASGVAESAIVTGGETLIFTLSHGTWSADVLAEMEAVGAAVLMNGSASGAGSWDDEVAAASDMEAAAVRTSDLVVTYTSPAAAGYSISGDETVTFALPQSLIQVNGQQWTGSTNLVCTPATFDITNGA